MQGTASSRGFDGLIVYNEKGKHPEEMVAGKFANKVAYICFIVYNLYFTGENSRSNGRLRLHGGIDRKIS